MLRQPRSRSVAGTVSAAFVLVLSVPGCGGCGQEKGDAALRPAAAKAATEDPASAPRPRAGVGEWSMFRGDLENTGISHSKRPKYTGLKWKHLTGSPMTSTPAVSAGKVIAASEAGYVNCIDAGSGKKIWEKKCGTGQPGQGIVFTSPLILDGRVYVGSKTGTLHCLDLGTGDEVFAFQAGEKEIYSSPKGDARGVVFGTVDGNIWCLDPKTGEKRWKVEAYREVGATAAILGDIVYIPGKDRNYYQIDYKTGKVLSKVQLPATTHCTAALGAGYAFLVIGGRKSIAWDLHKGEQAWEAEATSDDQIATAYADGVAYFPLGQFLWAMEAPTGKKLWEFKADHKIAPPVINGDDILIAGRDRKFRVLDRRTGRETWSYDLGEGFVAGPVLVDGVVYLAGDANEGMHVFAIE